MEETMREIVFLLEEESARAMLESLLPRLLDTEIGYRLIAFEGKQDLEKQLPRKIRAYRNPLARFIVLRDQDNHPDCREVKRNLLDLCAQSGRKDDCLVRIACTELESFYLADLAAVEIALDFPRLSSQQTNKKFRTPDTIHKPSNELRVLTKNRYQKISGSRDIGQHLDIENGRSTSFRNLVSAIRRIAKELQEAS
jgi:hypothetical protein